MCHFLLLGETPRPLKFNLNLCLDPYSGYKKNNIRLFMLDNLNISSTIAPSNWIFSNNYRSLIKKIKIKYDFLKKKNLFFLRQKIETS